MLKNISRLEVTVGERAYHLLCDSDSTIEELYRAISLMNEFILKHVEANASAMKKDEESKD